jgi:hypothetical protein
VCPCCRAALRNWSSSRGGCALVGPEVRVAPMPIVGPLWVPFSVGKLETLVQYTLVPVKQITENGQEVP